MTASHGLVKTGSHAAWADNIGMVKTRRTFWDRLQEAMRDKGLPTGSVTEAAKLAKKHQTAATKWKRGKLPSLQTTAFLAGELNVSTEWLLTGQGRKTPLTAYPDDLQAVIDAWPHLHPDIKQRILGAASFTRAVTYTGDPDRQTAVHEPIERYQAAHQKPRKTKPRPKAKK